MAQGVNGMRQFADRCDAEVARKRADQRALHERLGARMQTAVRGQIRGKINDAHGHVSGWQTKYIGTGGGYAAVRAADAGSGPDSRIHVTGGGSAGRF